MLASSPTTQQPNNPRTTQPGVLLRARVPITGVPNPDDSDIYLMTSSERQGCLRGSTGQGPAGSSCFRSPPRGSRNSASALRAFFCVLGEEWNTLLTQRNVVKWGLDISACLYMVTYANRDVCYGTRGQTHICLHNRRAPYPPKPTTTGIQ